MNKVEVVIVGSGATGSLLAAKLASAGKSVVILEGGPQRSLNDLVSSQLYARRLKWSGPPDQTEGKNPIGIGFNAGWGTGGSAVHHFGVWLRLHPEDFEMQSRFGQGLDWPIGYDELRPFYDRIQREVGVSGDAEKEIWRPQGESYPMPALPTFQHGMLIDRGFRKRGMRTAPLPLAINSIEYNERAACIFDGWCDSGCPIGALGNPLAVYLPQAEKAGARIIHEAFVSKVLTTEKGDRVSGVEYYDTQGRKIIQNADLVILSAFAIQNPRILLHSSNSKHPQGLGNSSGLVGKYLMTHSAGSIYGIFKEDTQNWLGVTGGQLLSQENYAKDRTKNYLRSSQWLIAQALKPNDLLGIANSRPDLFGNDLHKFIQTACKHLGTMTFVGESLPVKENEVTLSATRDRFGLPVARMTFGFAADELKLFVAGIKEGKEIFRSAQADEVWAGGGPNGMHILGGTIMGKTSQDSVTNSYGQTHDLPNLFVAGPGLFPTSGAVNPTFTIHALALRSAEYIRQNWSSIV